LMAMVLSMLMIYSSCLASGERACRLLANVDVRLQGVNRFILLVCLRSIEIAD
jgi:hypothetical protein